MAASKRNNPKTKATVYRTYRLDEPTRAAMKSSRHHKQLTVAAFIEKAIDDNLGGIVEELDAVGVPASLADEARPARLPMTDKLVNTLKKGSQRTGVLSTRLLVACIQRAAKNL